MDDPIARLNTALEGRYRIKRELGEGGMATVYLADDLRHERKVALKVLKPELAAIVGAERFLAEIKTTANLQHPHILPLFDSGEADSALFYVMPYVDGESLRERLDQENQLPVNEAIRIASDVAEALQAAHDHGVIHRDVKPANILLSQGRPLVSDFGIALAIGEAGGGRLTETGLSLGTPQYMSPEQATGDLHVGAPTDIYALGCVLFEMLVGEPPHTGPTPQAILGKVVAGGRVSATKRRASVPASVDGAIRKSLETLPADRFPSAREFVAALGDSGFRYGEAAAVDTRGGPRFGWLSMALSIAAALAVGLVLGRGVPTSGDGAAQLMHFPVALPAGETFALNLPGSQLALSPDGEWIAFVTAEGGLYRRRIGEIAAEPVPGSEGARTPFFSPDSRWLGFYAGGRLVRVPMAGGPAVPIAETQTPNGVSWGDDGTVVFSIQAPYRVYRVQSSGGEPVLLTEEEGTVYQYPWVLPGGGAVLLTSRGDRSEQRMVVLDLESGALDTLGLATRVTYASGHLLFSTAEGSLVAQPFDPDARRTTGEPFTILDSLAVGRGFGTGGGAFWPSSDGALVYATGGGDTRPLLIREGDSITPLGIEGVWDPAYSPDGRRIAMRIQDMAGGQDIWIIDREQGVLDRFTEQGYLNMTPVWTPDGERIAFMRHQVDDPEGSIYWQATDMSGPAELLLVSELRDFPGSWSPDGQTLAFFALRDGDMDIGLITVGDPTPRWLLESEANERQPQISPDGRWLAYRSDRSGRFEVYLQPLEGSGGRVTVSVDGGHSPRWDPQGGVLYYLTGAGQLVGATVDTDRGMRVTSREALFRARGFDVHPNGEEFVYVGGQADEGAVLGWIINWPEMIPEG